jgi:hypothetical protein
MTTDHRTLFKDNFCAVAADKECNCGNSYKENCKPPISWSWKSSFDFKWTNKHGESRQQSYAPHHILCVASIGTLIIQSTEKKVDGIVRKTVWCANTEKNMIAMPLWGHTVKWYCNLLDETVKSGKTTAPVFKDIPQHDWDHTGKGCYIEELNNEIVQLVEELNGAKHGATTNNLARMLDNLSDVFREKLRKRGIRGSPAGTDAGWNKGKNDQKGNSDWYLSFSMAKDKAAARKGYPKVTFNYKAMAKLRWLVKNL